MSPRRHRVAVIGHAAGERAGQLRLVRDARAAVLDVFRTPKQDAWLGLLLRDVFTGLSGDGVVIRK